MLIERGTGRKPPAAPVEVKVNVAGAYAEVELIFKKLPAPVAAAIRRLHPDGDIRELKKETRSSGKEPYAFKVFIKEKQWDVELAPDGTVLKNKPE